MYVRELQIRYRTKRITGTIPPPLRLLTTADTARLLQPLLVHEVIEVCGLVCLSARNDVLAYHELSRGTVDATVVHPRDVFRTALLANARAVLIGHNHPSGDPTPSSDDLALTCRIKAAGDLIGIDLVDSVIVGCNSVFSFKDAGLI